MDKQIRKMVRPKKYENNVKTIFSVQMPLHFREAYEDLVKLAAKDENPDFLEYCKMVEDADLDKLKQSRFSIYIRWILSKHRINNMFKLQK